jgi:hypothetical protein
LTHISPAQAGELKTKIIKVDLRPILGVGLYCLDGVYKDSLCAVPLPVLNEKTVIRKAVNL